MKDFSPLPTATGDEVVSWDKQDVSVGDTVSKIGMYGWTRGARLSQFAGRSQGQSDGGAAQFLTKERDFVFAKRSNLAHSLGTVDYFTGDKANGA